MKWVTYVKNTITNVTNMNYFPALWFLLNFSEAGPTTPTTPVPQVSLYWFSQPPKSKFPK